MRRLAIVLAVLAGLAAVLALTYQPMLEAAGRFLIVQDGLEAADVIVVLAGGQRDERIRQAADLFRNGYAPLVILSGTGPETLGFSVQQIMRLQAISHGIPASALLVEDTSTSTAQQARELRPVLEGRRVRRAIIVTSSFHSRRSAYLFHKFFAGSLIDIRLYPVQHDFFSPIEWWTREEDTERVLLEYFKLGLAVARFR